MHFSHIIQSSLQTAGTSGHNSGLNTEPALNCEFSVDKLNSRTKAHVCIRRMVSFDDIEFLTIKRLGGV